MHYSQEDFLRFANCSQVTTTSCEDNWCDPSGNTPEVNILLSSTLSRHIEFIFTSFEWKRWYSSDWRKNDQNSGYLLLSAVHIKMSYQRNTPFSFEGNPHDNYSDELHDVWKGVMRSGVSGLLFTLHLFFSANGHVNEWWIVTSWLENDYPMDRIRSICNEKTFVWNFVKHRLLHWEFKKGQYFFPIHLSHPLATIQLSTWCRLLSWGMNS